MENRIQDNYRWEAEFPGGRIVNKDNPNVEERKNLTDCIRFSLIPANGSGIPRHDIIKVKMERHLCRGFIKTPLAGKDELPGRLFWENGSRIQKCSEDWRKVLAPGDLVGKGVAGEFWYPVLKVEENHIVLLIPYKGHSKPNGMFCRRRPNPKFKKSFVYLHCIVCDGFRLWINYESGSMLAAPYDQEVYI